MLLGTYYAQNYASIIGGSLSITGAVFLQLELRTQLFVWDSYGDFYFSNFDLTYFNKYRMDFNPVRCITKYEALTTINWNGSL